MSVQVEDNIAEEPVEKSEERPRQLEFGLLTLAEVYAKLGGGVGLGLKLPRVYDHGATVEVYRDINGQKVSVATAQYHHLDQQIDANGVIIIRAAFTKLNTESQFVAIDPKWFEIK